jgi:hypothetical protein
VHALIEAHIQNNGGPGSDYNRIKFRQ